MHNVCTQSPSCLPYAPHAQPPWSRVLPGGCEDGNMTPSHISGSTVISTCHRPIRVPLLPPHLAPTGASARHHARLLRLQAPRGDDNTAQFLPYSWPPATKECSGWRALVTARAACTARAAFIAGNCHQARRYFERARAPGQMAAIDTKAVMDMDRSPPHYGFGGRKARSAGSCMHA